MKRSLLFVALAAAAALTLSLFISCNSDDPATQANLKSLVGTKWTTTDWGYDIDDDLHWAYYYDEFSAVYFYGETEGLAYYSRKDVDSDEGNSMSRQVVFFKYHVDGNQIKIETIPENITGTLTLQDGKLKTSDYNLFHGNDFSDGKMNSNDYNWTYQIHGTTGDCQWYDNYYCLIITGKGRMANYSSYTNTPWSLKRRSVNRVYIDKDVEYIGSYAFASPSIGNVEIENSHKDAFREIGNYAFAGSSIGNLSLFDTKIVGKGAFSGCEYADVSFYDVEEIGDEACYGCKYAYLGLSDKLRRVGSHAFNGGCIIYGWPRTNVIEYIGNGAFGQIKNRTEIDLPLIKELGSLAFSGTKLNKIHIGPNLYKVTGTPFINVASSGTLTIDASNPPTLSYNFIDDSCVKNWNLVVPASSKSKYSTANYWRNFKTINGSTNTDSPGDNTDSPDDNTDSPDDNTDSPDDNIGSSNLTITVKGISFVMVPVKGGTFTMGATAEQTGADSDESPTHNVTLSSYYIGQTEVTQALWKAVTGYSPTSVGGGWPSTHGLGDNYPAYSISYNDVRSFITKLNRLTGRTFRMPTEAEWEYAARGGSKRKGYLYSGSNTIDNVAWYTSNSGSTTHPVAQKTANELGLYDMSGNVDEWCSDWYGSYSSSSQTNPTGPSTGSTRVLRGGYWNNNAASCRVANRNYATPSVHYGNHGVRLVLSSSQK